MSQIVHLKDGCLALQESSQSLRQSGRMTLNKKCPLLLSPVLTFPVPASVWQL